MGFSTGITQDWTQEQWNWVFLLQQLDCVACTMQWCAVFLEENKIIIFAAMCLITANIFSDNRIIQFVLWLLFHAYQSKTSIVDMQSCRLKPQQTFWLSILWIMLLPKIIKKQILLAQLTAKNVRDLFLIHWVVYTVFLVLYGIEYALLFGYWQIFSCFCVIYRNLMQSV